ncbi:MAG TPA: MFS transporter [Candidatus Dormibacteraeota bacterium]|nr:MFS transporter [Candidatus Dormibacteraeota bacterium]
MSTDKAVTTSSTRASGWITLLVLFGLASTIEAFTVSHVFRFLPLYLATVHVAPADVPAWTGYLNAAFFLFGLPLVPFWGVWAERYGRIPIIARSAFVEMVVFAVLWFAQNRWEAAFGLLLVGFQLGNTGVMLTALRAVTPQGRVGFAISLFGVSPSLGFALGPTVGGWLVDHHVLDLHSLFILDAAMSLIAGTVLLVFAREGPRPPAPAGSAVSLAIGALRMALTGRTTRIVFGVFGLAYFAQQIANPFLPLLVIRLIGGTAGAAGQIGIVFGASALLGALLSPIAGAAGDRYGFRPLLAGACVLAAASLAGLALAPNLVWLTVGAVALGAATATAISMVFALLATAVPEERRATTLNLVLLPIYFSSIAGAVLGAVLVRQGLNTVLFTAAAISLVALLLTTRLPSSRTAAKQV